MANLLVGGKLYESKQQHPGICIAMNARPLSIVMVEAAALRYVQSALRQMFFGQSIVRAHTELARFMERYGGLAYVSQETLEEYPQVIALNNFVVDWEIEDGVDLLGLLYEAYVGDSFATFIEGPLYRSMDVTIFNVKKQTEDLLKHLINHLMYRIHRTNASFGFTPGEIDEDGWVNLYITIRYDTLRFGPREWACYMRFNFIERQSMMCTKASGAPVINMAFPWLPKDIIGNIVC